MDVNKFLELRKNIMHSFIILFFSIEACMTDQILLHKSLYQDNVTARYVMKGSEG